MVAVKEKMRKYLTNQEIFDKVAKHLLTQKEKSSRGSSCLYRGSDGLKCAVGCLIPDEFYVKSIEHEGVKELFSNFSDLMEKSKLKIESERLLLDLQNIHDDCDIDEWKELLKFSARDFKLDSKVLDKF